MSGVSMCRVVLVGGREGALWLPAGGIRASQGTFSSLKKKCSAFFLTQKMASKNT